MRRFQQGDALDTVLIVCAIIAAIGCALMAGVTTARDQKAWATFSAEHSCVLVGVSEGTVVKDGEKSYLCDDGVTYTRSE